MNNIVVKRIDASNCAALALPNEPFPLFGRLVVERADGQWQHREELFTQTTTQTFPDEHYQLADIDAAGFALGAFTADGTCIGLATYAWRWNKYLYLDDLKVNGDFRGQGLQPSCWMPLNHWRRRAGCAGSRPLPRTIT
nr:GNAT family N-acetyltransferase [Lacticaseibacillus sharpeae]